MSCGTALGVKSHQNRNEPPCPGCKKFMTNPSDVVYQPAPKVRAKKSPGRPRVAVCGTQSGYKKHLRLGEAVCDDCRTSEAKRVRDYRGVSSGPRVLQPCGTPAAALRHRRLGEEVCDPCRLAINEANRRYREVAPGDRRPSGRKPAPCGTFSAYRRHQRLGEEIDASCQAARDENNKSRRIESKQISDIKCGTPAGYRKHKRLGEQADDDCLDAWKKESARIRRQHGRPEELPVKVFQPCGTSAAFQRHKRAGEEVDEPCRAAENKRLQFTQTRKRERENVKLNPKKVAVMPQSTLDQYLTSYVEQGLEDTENYQTLWTEHQSRTKAQQEEMTEKEFSANEH